MRNDESHHHAAKFISSLVAIPFVMIKDWLQFLNGLPPRQKELTIASHGVVMIVTAATLAYELQYDELPVPSAIERAWFFWAFVALSVWGAVWFFRGAWRSRGQRDASLMARAVVKIAFGIACYILRNKIPDYPLIGPFEPAIMWGLAYWCTITGTVKLMLLLMPQPPPPDLDDRDPGDLPHSGFSTRLT